VRTLRKPSISLRCFSCSWSVSLQVPLNSRRVNEEMIETLFICNPANAPAKEATRRPVLPTPKAENKVLDPKKAQNIAILLRALNVTKEEVSDALCEGEEDPR
jgi:hypothetical protein